MLFKTPIPRYNRGVRWLQRFYIKLYVWVSWIERDSDWLKSKTQFWSQLKREWKKKKKKISTLCGIEEFSFCSKHTRKINCGFSPGQLFGVTIT